MKLSGLAVSHGRRLDRHGCEPATTPSGTKESGVQIGSSQRNAGRKGTDLEIASGIFSSDPGDPHWHTVLPMWMKYMKLTFSLLVVWMCLMSFMYFSFNLAGEWQNDPQLSENFFRKFNHWFAGFGAPWFVWAGSCNILNIHPAQHIWRRQCLLLNSDLWCATHFFDSQFSSILINSYQFWNSCGILVCKWFPPFFLMETGREASSDFIGKSSTNKSGHGHDQRPHLDNIPKPKPTSPEASRNHKK